MGFLDKAKEKATQLAGQAKEKIDDVKEKRKVDDLLDDLGRITYRQHTGRGEDGDGTEIARLVAELKTHEDAGAPVLGPKEPLEPVVSDASTAATDAPPPPPPPPQMG